MDLLEAMQQRHSVRRYRNEKMKDETRELLKKEIADCNEESGLNMQLILDEPKAFGSWFAHFGRFSGVQDYIAVVGKETPEAYEKCGYYGERIVLYAQMLELNTCWVSGSYKQNTDAARISQDEKMILVITVGYGTDNGRPSRSKTIEEVTDVPGDMPEWFIKGVQAALLAPTGMNRQKFCFKLEGKNTVSCSYGEKLSDYVSLGIVKYHFEMAAGKENFNWKE